MDVQFVASVSVIAPDPAASRRLYVETLGLPLEDASREPPVPMEAIAAAAKAKAPTPATRPRLSPYAWMGLLFGTAFLGFLGWGALLWQHASRGAHFPVRIGETVVINHPLRGCRVESLTVTRGPFRQEMLSGERGSYPAQVARYEASLEVVSVRPGVTTSAIVVGMGGSGRLVRSDRAVAFTAQGQRRTVTLQSDWPGSGPEYVLLRETD